MAEQSPDNSVRPEVPKMRPIGNDLFCIRCGYNLRTLQRDSRCPECGTPIPLSLYDRPLGMASPAWLATLRRGLLLYALLMVLTAAIALYSFARYGDAWSPVFPGLTTLLIAFPILFATRPDPGDPEGASLTRRLVRLICYPGALVGLAAVVIISLAKLGAWPPATADTYCGIWSLAAGFAGAAMHGLFFTYLAELAQRTRYKLFAGFGYIVAASPFYGICAGCLQLALARPLGGGGSNLWQVASLWALTTFGIPAGYCLAYAWVTLLEQADHLLPHRRPPF